jgi:dihydrofolate reductase
MRTLAVNTFMSLDGVMQAPGGPHEDPTGGFQFGGWGATYFDEEMMREMEEAEPYELLLGRGTYEIFAAHWPYADGPSQTASTASASTSPRGRSRPRTGATRS